MADVPEPDASDRVVDNKTVAQPKAAQPHVPEAPLPNRNDEDFHPAAPDSYKNVNSGGSARRLLASPLNQANP